MTDWQENGRQLRQEWLAARQPLPGHKQQLAAMERVLRERPSFTYCVLEYLNGNPSLLAKFLRSDRRLDRESRISLADAIEGRYDRKPHLGRKQDQALRQAARTAELFYDQWRKRNNRDGVSDWGNRDTMKDEAVHIALEIAGHCVDHESVRQLLDRPKSRRNS